MDKNTFIGLLLIAGIMIGFSIWNAPSEEELARQNEITDSIRQAKLEQKVKEELDESEVNLLNENATEEFDLIGDSLDYNQLVLEDSLAIDQLLEQQEGGKDLEHAKQLYGLFAPAYLKEVETFQVKTEKLTLTFSTLGGRILDASLVNYEAFGGGNLVLFDSTSHFNLEFFSKDNKNIFTDELVFESNHRKDIEIRGDDEIELSFKLKLNESRYIEYIYTIFGDDYLIDFDVNLVGMDDVIDVRSGDLALNWMINAPTQEQSVKKQREASSVYYKYKGESVDDLGYKDKEENFVSSIEWVSFKQQFFNTTIISDDFFDKSKAFASTKSDEEDEYYVKEFKTSVALPISGKKVENFGMKFYFGPNQYKDLKALGIGLERVIPLGWGIFGWVNKYAVIPVFNFLDGFGWGYGIIILILTVLLKVVLFPITYKTYMSSAKMRVLKPEIDVINEKHKDDAVKKQQEMMDLYRKTGVNPLSGCIPMLIQMPILIAMFRFFPASIELRQESFLWVEDLSTYDSIYNFPDGFSIPFYGDHISLFTLLMAISMVFYTRLNSQMGMGAAQGPMAGQMKTMMYLMPVMMLFFFNNYASGLSYYYFLANLITIGQTLLIRKVFINEDKIRAKIEENKKKPKAKKKSSFQKRLEEMAKQQGANSPKR